MSYFSAWRVLSASVAAANATTTRCPGRVAKTASPPDPEVPVANAICRATTGLLARTVPVLRSTTVRPLDPRNAISCASAGITI